MRAIGLIDCNNFFVSCERVFRPDLAKMPVVVLSSNDGCVVARSQEIKDSGIPMGVPYFLIKDKLAEMKATVFSSNFNLYKDISKRVFEIVKSELSELQRYSIDECFFTIDASEIDVLQKLRDRIRREVGIPVSIGVSTSRTLAKYANQVAKKTKEIEILSSEGWAVMSDKVKLSELWGVGTGRVRQFSKEGIITARDLLNTPNFVIDQLYGINGLRLKNEISGGYVPYSQPEVDQMQNSVTSSRSFAKAVFDMSSLRSALSYHVANLVKELHASEWLATGIRVYIYPSYHGDFALSGGMADSLFLVPTNDVFVIESEVSRLLKMVYQKGIPYKKAGIILTDLVPVGVVSESLFSVSAKTKEVTNTLVAINKKYGSSSLRLGTAVDSRTSWQSKKELISPSYTTDWKGLCIVVAR